MARPPKYERRMADLQCNACDHRFRERVLHVGQRADEAPDWIEWSVEPEWYSGLKCPACGSRLIDPQR